MKKFIPNMGTVELCVTYACNVKCDNCSNLCTQAPAKSHLTPADVKRFLADSWASENVWGQITIHGGEPVLNPWIYDIVRLLVEYRVETGCHLYLLSNNSNQKIREVITRIAIQYDIALGVSTKQDRNIDANGNAIEYIPVNESPEDLNLPFTNGCFQTTDCGVCFNYLGYFPCSPMAAAARVFGYKGVQTIKELTLEKSEEYFKLHCKHCGFAIENRRRVVDQIVTKTWAGAFKLYEMQKGL